MSLVVGTKNRHIFICGECIWQSQDHDLSVQQGMKQWQTLSRYPYPITLAVTSKMDAVVKVERGHTKPRGKKHRKNKNFSLCEEIDTFVWPQSRIQVYTHEHSSTCTGTMKFMQQLIDKGKLDVPPDSALNTTDEILLKSTPPRDTKRVWQVQLIPARAVRQHQLPL